jgi:signal transduction histidine kinase
MSDVVTGVLVALGKTASEAVTVEGSLPSVLAQKTLAHQCVANLVENGLKFVPDGAKPKIRIRAERVSSASLAPPSDTELLSRSRFTAFDSGTSSAVPQARVRIWVEDEGIGIPPEARNKIFGIFERAVANDQFDGTGIGLAIVARAMERMEGACGVESELGSGSRFWLEFRCVPDAETLDGEGSKKAGTIPAAGV